jgi:hypothetical protein
MESFIKVNVCESIRASKLEYYSSLIDVSTIRMLRACEKGVAIYFKHSDIPVYVSNSLEELSVLIENAI